jgi:hypothetical protein
MVQGVPDTGLVDMHDFYRGTAGSLTRVGNIRTNGSSTSYNTSSDYRLKEDDVPMTGATERVKALRPINFAWKVDGSRVDGFLAHEVQEIVPEAISGTKDAMTAEVLYVEGDEMTMVMLLLKLLWVLVAFLICRALTNQNLSHCLLRHYKKLLLRLKT